MELHPPLGSVSSPCRQKSCCQNGAGWPQPALKCLQLGAEMPEIQLSCPSRVIDRAGVALVQHPCPCWVPWGGTKGLPGWPGELLVPWWASWARCLPKCQCSGLPRQQTSFFAPQKSALGLLHQSQSRNDKHFYLCACWMCHFLNKDINVFLY